MWLSPVAPGISTPSRRHCSAITGSGSPLHVPGSTVSSVPTTPLPVSVGATTRAGATRAGTSATTLTRKLAAADPPEFVPVTTTSSASRSASVGILTTPSASISAPPPSTEKTSASPSKTSPAATVCRPLPRTNSTSASTPATGATRVTAIAAVASVTLPATLLAVTRQLSAARSSSGTGT